MKLLTYKKDNSISCGLVIDSSIIDIPSNWQGDNAPRSILNILERPGCLEKVCSLSNTTENMIPIDSVKILAPIPRPGKILALAGNYAKHIIEGGLKLGLTESPRTNTVPRPFIMPSTAVIGDGDTIAYPMYSDEVDYELELAVIIGRKTRCVRIDDALDHVAGYTIVNDVSARSVTFKEARKQRPWDEFYDWLNGKWSDGFCPMGPYLVTKDEIPDPQNLTMKLTVNDEVRQDANTSQMIYHVADIVSFISHIMTLEPGDIIATGTPHGVGMATGNFLKPGDIIKCQIENLGTLTNTLGEKPEKLYKPLEA